MNGSCYINSFAYAQTVFEMCDARNTERLGIDEDAIEFSNGGCENSNRANDQAIFDRPCGTI